MSSFEASPTFMDTVMYRILNIPGTSTSTTAANAPLLSSANNGTAQTQIILMKGAVPTSLDGLTTFAASGRSSDMLVRFMGGNTNFGGSTGVANPCFLTTAYVTAIASGTATWFWWSAENLNGQASPGNGSGALIHQIIGTVGLTGSGAELEMEDTNIVSGQQYRMVGVQMRLPDYWSY